MIDPFSWIATGAQTLASLQIADKNYKSQQETNAANERSVAATNASNERMVAATNASNVEQANIAYERSKPVTQVANMMDAGMSKAGAINSLSGGGVYTPPALSTATAQSSTQQAPQYDYSGIAQAIDRFANIPSNVMQRDIQSQQLADLRQEAQLRHNEDMRKQEQHDFDMWRERYGKKTAELLDGVSTKVVQAAAAKGYDLSSAKTVQNIMRDLGLENDLDYQNMPHLARLQLFDAIKSQNEQLIEQQTHEANMRKSQLEDSIAQANLRQMAEDYQNSVKEHRTQEKERLVREGRAALENILVQNHINQEDFLRDIRFDKDGKPNFVTRTKAEFKEAWSLIGSILPVDYLGDILRGLIAIGPK